MKLNGSSVSFNGEFITLGQLLKFLDLVSTGGEERLFLATHKVTFNGETENRRGKKLRNGDTITIDGKKYSLCSSND